MNTRIHHVDNGFLQLQKMYMMYNTTHSVCAYQQIEFILSILSATNDRINWAFWEIFNWFSLFRHFDEKIVFILLNC